MKAIVIQFINSISYHNFPLLNKLLAVNCILIGHDKVSYGQEKIIRYLKTKIKDYHIKHISILNSIQDSKDTLLVSYHIIIENESSPIYGSAVIQISDKQIHYIKNFIVNNNLNSSI